MKSKVLPGEKKKPRIFYGYIILIAAFVYDLVSWGMWATFPIFFEPMLDEFGWTRAATSGPFSLYLLIAASLGVAMGKLNDKFGPKMLITVSGVFLGLGYGLLSQVSTIWQFYLFYGVMLGIGQSGWIAVISTVSRWFVRRRALVLGIVTSGFSLSLVIFPQPATWLLGLYGWRNSYIIIGVFTLVLIIASAQFLHRDPSQKGLSAYGEDKTRESQSKRENQSVQVRGLSFQEAVHTKQLWMLCATFFFLLVNYSAMMVHIVIYATGIGVSAANAANILVIAGAVGVAGGLGLGSAAGKIGSRRTLTIICAMALVAATVLLTTAKLWVLYLFAVIFGFAYGAFWALMAPTVAELFGLKNHGILLGFASFIGMVGEASGPVLAGYIYDVNRSYHGAFLLGAAVSLTALVLTLLLKPTRFSTSSANLLSRTSTSSGEDG